MLTAFAIGGLGAYLAYVIVMVANGRGANI